MSDSDEDMDDLQRIQRIAESHFKAGTWPLADGNSSSDEDWIQSATPNQISALKREYNNLKRDWKNRQPPSWHIQKLVVKDGPAARKEIERLITEFRVDLNSVYELHEYGKLKGQPQNPLLFCVTSMPMLNLLVKHGIDINKRGMSGSLHFLHHTKSSVITKYLLSNGVDPNIRDDLGRTPLQLSYSEFGQYEKGNKSRIDFLIRAGADMNAQDKRGKGIIHEIYRMFWTSGGGPKLIEEGAKVNLQDIDGSTCLHIFEAVLENDIKTYHAPRYRGLGLVAVIKDQYKNMEKIFYNLFKHGSNPFIKNKKGYAVIDNLHVAEIYSKYIANLLNSEQKLAIAKLLIVNKEDELPLEVIELIGKILEEVHVKKLGTSEYLKSSRKTFKKMLREILLPKIRESYPEFDTDDMVARYEELIKNPNTSTQQKEKYEKFMAKRLEKLKRMNSSKSLKSNDSRNSRSVRSSSIPNKSERESRSLNSEEEIEEALRVSLQPEQLGKKKTKKKKNTQKKKKKNTQKNKKKKNTKRNQNK